MSATEDMGKATSNYWAEAQDVGPPHESLTIAVEGGLIRDEPVQSGTNEPAPPVDGGGAPKTMADENHIDVVETSALEVGFEVAAESDWSGANDGGAAAAMIADRVEFTDEVGSEAVAELTDAEDAGSARASEPETPGGKNENTAGKRRTRARRTK